MKRNIVSLIIATTIITGVMPTTANAETVNSIMSFVKSDANTLISSMSNLGGGIIGAIFCSVFVALLTLDGTVVVAIALIICGFLMFTGLSIYEKALIPLFADAKFLIIKPRKFTPYIECGVGYSFAPDKNANGGFYLNPSAGVEYSICKSKKLFLALGYESQKIERLKTQKQSLFTAEFAEKLSHNAISIKIGFIF